MHPLPLIALLVAGAPSPRAIPGTEVELALPSDLAAKTAASESGYVDVIFGVPGTDPCVVGVEVYTPAAPDRPADLKALQQSLVSDHADTQAQVEPAKVESLAGRKFARFASRSKKSGVLQRQWATFVGKSAVVLSFYGIAGDRACAALEKSAPASLTTAK